MASGQQPAEKLDLSAMLHTILAARGLTVGELAAIAGVSKSAMEKYLSGPSSPRAVAVANLATGLGLSADTIMFGELDPNIEAAYQLAFKAFAELIKDLKGDSELAAKFDASDFGSVAFGDFVRDLAFERAGQFKRALNAAHRSDGRPSQDH